MGNRTTKTTTSPSPLSSYSSKNSHHHHHVVTLGDYRYIEDTANRLSHHHQHQSRNAGNNNNDPAVGGSDYNSNIWRGWKIADKQQLVTVKKLIASDLANQEIDCMLSVFDQQQQQVGNNNNNSGNILKLLDVHVRTPYVYVISEYYTCDLEEFLSAVKGHIDWRDQLPILAGNLSRGYYALYRKGILHRNINSHTVVVVHRGTEITFKLSSFEYAKKTTTTSRTTQTLVDVNLDPYKAPELGAAIVSEREDFAYDHRVDIWSLGTILYRCAVGRTPWTSSEVAKLFFTLATHRTATVTNLLRIQHDEEFKLNLPDDLPAKLADLLKSMLRINVANRMTAEEFIRHDYVTGGKEQERLLFVEEAEDEGSVVRHRQTDNTLFYDDSSSSVVRDSFTLQTKQIECIGRHTLKRRKQMKEEKRLEDLVFTSSDAAEQQQNRKPSIILNLDDHYSTLRHEDLLEENDDNTIRQVLPPPLPPRRKSSSSASRTSLNGNSRGGLLAAPMAAAEDSSDTGSVGSQTLLAEGMQVLSEQPTIRSVENEEGGDDCSGSVGTIRGGGTCETKNGDPPDVCGDVPETRLDNDHSVVRTVLVGPYEYQEDPSSFLGRGSFGSVWTGRSRTTNSFEPVAIKALTYLAGADREIRILRSVPAHPNVLRFLYAHKIGNTLYMVTELCRCDLKSFLDASPNRRLSGEDVRKAARDLARGYQALFTSRIMHRDIKPKNILLAQSSSSSSSGDDQNRTRDFILKLADFGCGRFRDSSQTDSSPMTKGAMGTIEYMAPEVGARQMNPDSRYDARADVWSIGVVLHECACGRLPVSRMDLWRLSMSVASDGRLADSRLDTSSLLLVNGGQNDEEQQQYPEQFKQLLYDMLQPLYQLRLKPEQLFAHPYITQAPTTGGLKLAPSGPRKSLAMK